MMLSSSTIVICANQIEAVTLFSVGTTVVSYLIILKANVFNGFFPSQQELYIMQVSDNVDLNEGKQIRKVA